jgi:4'-phosphopantetheinyl transferase
VFYEWDDSAPARHRVASLGRAEVQVWTATIPPEEAVLADLARQLSPAERQRADQFTVPAPRRQFVFGRAWLRQLLGLCLALEPAALEFGRQAHGKPRLTLPVRDTGLRFNLSHSGQKAAVVLARGREVGVDIELIHPLHDWGHLTERIFSPRELGELHALPQPQQLTAFYNGWTRKEAWLKATGDGLTNALSAIEVTLAPGKEPAWLALPGGPQARQHWALRALPPMPDYAGAVVWGELIG